MDVTQTAVNIEVMVNGSPQQLPAGATVADLVGRLNLRPENIAVEVNLALVPRPEHHARQLQGGDQVEIVTLVGGGSGASACGARSAPLILDPSPRTTD